MYFGLSEVTAEAARACHDACARDGGLALQRREERRGDRAGDILRGARGGLLRVPVMWAKSAGGMGPRASIERTRFSRSLALCLFCFFVWNPRCIARSQAS